MRITANKSRSPVGKPSYEPIYNYALVLFIYLAVMEDLNRSTKRFDKMWLGVAQQRIIMDDVSSHCVKPEKKRDLCT